MTTVRDIYNFIDSIASFDTQEQWDNSGLLVGDFNETVKKAVIALDCTADVVDYAADMNSELIITHHPVIFNGVKSVKKGSVLYRLINSGISVISVHTPYDKAEGGINDSLAKILGLENIHKYTNDYLTFGTLPIEMSIDDFASFVSDKLDCHALRYTKCDNPVSSVCVCGGSCEEFVTQAMEYADCFVTGDLKYHTMLDADQSNFAVISAGHFETENKAFLMIKERLERIFADVEFLIAPAENPVLEI